MPRNVRTVWKQASGKTIMMFSLLPAAHLFAPDLALRQFAFLPSIHMHWRTTNKLNSRKISGVCRYNPFCLQKKRMTLRRAYARACDLRYQRVYAFCLRETDGRLRW